MKIADEGDQCQTKETEDQQISENARTPQITTTNRPDPSQLQEAIQPPEIVIDILAETPKTGQAAGGVSKSKSHPKKRHLREDWKIVENDEAGTLDRKNNLVLDSSDDWGMWCKVCTAVAPRLGLKFCSNFVKKSSQF